MARRPFMTTRPVGPTISRSWSPPRFWSVNARRGVLYHDEPTIIEGQCIIGVSNCQESAPKPTRGWKA